MTESVLTIRKRDKTFLVRDTEHQQFWKRLEAGAWEEETFDILDRYLTKEVVFLDVGSWIGPTTLYGAQIAHSTYSFEPDPVARKELLENVQLNATTTWARSIAIVPAAIAPHSGDLLLGNRGAGGDSMSSVLFQHYATKWTVSCKTLEAVLAEYGLNRKPLLIKIDIEGGEFQLMPSLRALLKRENVTLYLSLHRNFLCSTLTPGRSFVSRLRRRSQLFRAHVAVLRALPRGFLYSRSGARLNRYAALARLLLHGVFPDEILFVRQRSQRDA